MPTPAERVADLSQRIRAHDHAYYVLSAPTITDAEYDALVNCVSSCAGTRWVGESTCTNSG